MVPGRNRGRLDQLGWGLSQSRPQLFEGWGPCPSDIQHLLDAYCVPWSWLGPDGLGTQGGQSPSPPSQGPGCLGGSRHGAGGQRGWMSPGA